MARMHPMVALERLASIYDSYANDSDNSIDDTYDMVEAMADILGEAGRLTSCSMHGWWASFRDNCPACEWCSDCEQSPCACEPEEEDL